jgi:hypothetical protein
MPEELDRWLQAARADAAAHGRDAVVPLLDSLKTALARLRAADWNDDASGREASASPRATPPGDR